VLGNIVVATAVSLVFGLSTMLLQLLVGYGMDERNRELMKKVENMHSGMKQM
jgi:hypothetical protein